MAEVQMTAVPEGRSDADALLAQDDAAFAEMFLKGSPVDSTPAPAAEAAPLAPETPVAPVRDPATGQFAKADEASPIETIGQPADAEATDTPVVPVKEPAVLTAPITPFRVFDAEGELEIPDIEIELKTNGKVKKVKIDQVVRLAQMGGYNEELQQQAQDARTRIPSLEQQVAQVTAELHAQGTLNKHILADEAFFLASRDKYEAAMTPEAQLAAANQRIAELERGPRPGSADADLAQQGDAFTVGTLAPVFDGLLTAYPTVPLAEAYGQFVLLTQPLQERGIIPPARWSEVMQLVEGSLGPWMAQLHDKRASQAAQRDTATAEALKAKEEATKAKRTLARRFKPSGSTPESALNPTSPTKPPETADDAVNQIMAGVAQTLRR